MRRLLVVEDNAVMREMLRCVLARHRFIVMTASNGAEALELAALHELDAVLTDYDMPSVDGLEVCRMLRRQSAVSGRRVPVWIMHRSSDANLILHAFSAGAIAVLNKPVRTADLCKRFVQQFRYIERIGHLRFADPAPAHERSIAAKARRRATALGEALSRARAG